MKRFLIFLLAAGAFSMAAGCNRQSQPEKSQAVLLQLLDHAGYERLVASKQGKVVVVDCWSTSCVPCMEKFPKLVELSRKYPDTVACVSLSLDYEGVGKPEESSEKVLAFLRSKEAAFDNVLATLDSIEMYDKLQISAVPAVIVYDRQGNRVQTFEGEEVDYAEVEQLAAKLASGS
jgi:thiol-disulfide isomerase/thioredoxin